MKHGFQWRLFAFLLASALLCGCASTLPGGDVSLVHLPPGSSSAPAVDANTGLPKFPWPVPEPSASAPIALHDLMSEWKSKKYFPAHPAGAPLLKAEDEQDFYNKPMRLQHADYALRYLLGQQGYVEISYYAVPGGFAMVTQMEQMQANGRPMEPGRWDLSGQPVKPFTLASYLRALFQAPEGYYRTLVFVLTTKDVETAGPAMTSESVDELLHDGGQKLPKKLAMRSFTNKFDCTVLIYEFHKRDGMDVGLRQPGLSFADTLRATGLTELLQ